MFNHYPDSNTKAARDIDDAEVRGTEIADRREDLVDQFTEDFTEFKQAATDIEAEDFMDLVMTAVDTEDRDEIVACIRDAQQKIYTEVAERVAREEFGE